MGLFDGLRAGLGGLGAKARGFFGEQPGALTAQAQDPIVDERAGVLRRPDVLTQGPPTSFLDRLTAPSDDGIQFRDRLFAVGSALQGDTGGAAQYMRDARNEAVRKGDKAEAKEQMRRKSAAFKAAYQGGTFRPEIYAELAGDELDPSDLAGLEKAFRPDYSFQNAGGGLYRTDARRGTAEQVVGPKPTLEKFVQDPETGEWGVNPAFLDAEGRIAGARRQAIVDRPMPARPRAPARPKAGAGPWSNY